MLSKIWIFPYIEDQRKLFKTEQLWQRWSELYPDIFDEDDLRIVRNQAALGYHYYEWLAAILVYQSTGYLCLVEQYGFGNHQRKQEILRRLVSPEIMGLLKNQPGRVQNPDLLVYSPLYADWFFCEVKGPNDRLQPVQKEFFADLEKTTGKPVYMIKFKPVV